MKKFPVFLASILLVGAFAWALPPVWLSSTTATADTTKVLCPQVFTTQMGHGVFHGVCVDEPIVGGLGTLTVFNSSATTANPIMPVTTYTPPGGGVGNCLYYDVAFSSGLSYSTVSTATVTMLYACTSAQ